MGKKERTYWVLWWRARKGKESRTGEENRAAGVVSLERARLIERRVRERP